MVYLDIIKTVMLFINFLGCNDKLTNYKNILKNFKFIKYKDQKHDYFTFHKSEKKMI
jgi:hypothetical protein